MVQICLAGDGHCGLAAVAGNHNNLNTRLLYLLDGLASLGTDVITDTNQTDQHQIVVNLVADELLTAVAEGQHAHGAVCQGVDFCVEGRLVDRYLIALGVQTLLGLGQEALGRALVEGAALAGQVGLAELVCAVKVLLCSDLAVLAGRQRAEGILAEELQERLVGHVAADDIVLVVKERACVLADAQVQGLGHLGRSGDVGRPAAAVKKLDDLKLALGDGARLIAEQDVERTGGLDADGLAHKHIDLEQLARVLHEDKGDDERQALRHGADDDGDGDRDGVHDVAQDRNAASRQISGQAAREHDKVDEVGQGDDDRAHVAKDRDLPGQLVELDFKGRVRLLVLHVLGHLAHHGGEADLLDDHIALAVEHGRAAEQAVCIDEGIARDGLRDGKALWGLGLGALLGLAVERAVIDRERALGQDAVGQDLVARLQQDDVADNHVVSLNDLDDAVTDDLDRVLLLGSLEVAVGAVIGHARAGRDKVDEQDGDDGADRLIPIALADQVHAEHDNRDDAQDADHRVLEAL